MPLRVPADSGRKTGRGGRARRRRGPARGLGGLCGSMLALTLTCVSDPLMALQSRGVEVNRKLECRPDRCMQGPPEQPGRQGRLAGESRQGQNETPKLYIRGPTARRGLTR